MLLRFCHIIWIKVCVILATEKRNKLLVGWLSGNVRFLNDDEKFDERKLLITTGITRGAHQWQTLKAHNLCYISIGFRIKF